MCAARINRKAFIFSEKRTTGHCPIQNFLEMKHREQSGKTGPQRLTRRDLATVDDFKRWWIRCSKCSRLAYMTPNWKQMEGECKCGACGGVYSLKFNPEYDRRFSSLALWLKADFRGNIFWALNGEHLQLLERVNSLHSQETPGNAWKALVLYHADAIQSPVLDLIREKSAGFTKADCTSNSHDSRRNCAPTSQVTSRLIWLTLNRKSDGTDLQEAGCEHQRICRVVFSGPVPVIVHRQGTRANIRYIDTWFLPGHLFNERGRLTSRPPCTSCFLAQKPRLLLLRGSRD